MFCLVLLVVIVGCPNISTSEVTSSDAIGEVFNSDGSMYDIPHSNMDIKVKRYVCDVDTLEVEYEAIVNSCNDKGCSNTVTCMNKVDMERVGEMFYLNGINSRVSGYRRVGVPKDGSDHSIELCCLGGYSAIDIEGEGVDCAYVEISNVDVERSCP